MMFTLNKITCLDYICSENCVRTNPYCFPIPMAFPFPYIHPSKQRDMGKNTQILQIWTLLELDDIVSCRRHLK